MFLQGEYAIIPLKKTDVQAETQQICAVKWKGENRSMGLIRAGLGAVGGVLADQWKEFFYCDAIDNDVLVVKGRKRTSGRSSNTRGEDNIISNGSGIAVADGQCMIIVEQGKVVEVCAEPGEFTYDTSTEPSIFAGSLGESIKATFKTIGRQGSARLLLQHQGDP